MRNFCLATRRLTLLLPWLLALACVPTKRPKAALQEATTAGDDCRGVEHPYMPDYGDANKLRLVFCDGFDGNALDASKWVANFGWGNITKPTGHEDHEVNFDYDAYFDASLLKVADGQLHLNAINQASPQAVHGAQWTSSAVSGHFQFEYGYIEARIRAPDTHGLWPAFWITFPFNWPPEIDIMELRTNMLPNGVYNYKVNVNYIYGPAWNNKNSSYLELDRWAMQRAGLCDANEQGCGRKFSEFNTYGVAWQPEQLDYFYNGIRVFSARIQDQPRGKMGALLINLAVGGWAERPDAATDWSKAHMDIDWVRIWEFPTSPTLFAYADPSLGAAPPAPAPVPPTATPSTPSTSSTPTRSDVPHCPAGNDGTGAKWCDCYQPTTCYPWCIATKSGDWGYEALPPPNGPQQSCHVAPRS